MVHLKKIYEFLKKKEKKIIHLIKIWKIKIHVTIFVICPFFQEYSIKNTSWKIKLIFLSIVKNKFNIKKINRKVFIVKWKAKSARWVKAADSAVVATADSWLRESSGGEVATKNV